MSPQPQVKHHDEVRGRGSWKAPLPEAVASDARRAENHQPIHASEGRGSATASYSRTPLDGHRSCLHCSPWALRTRTFNSAHEKHLSHNATVTHDRVPPRMRSHAATATE